MRPASLAARALAAVAVAVALLGVPLALLQTPPVTRALVARYYDPATGGIPRSLALRTAEEARRYATDPSAPALPETVGGRPGFDEAAATHLRDVRRVFLAADAVTIAVVVALAVALALALRAGRRRATAWALAGGAIATVAAVLGVGGWALADFESFFTALHGVFFAAGTWTFPYGTLLIELFPEPLWGALGALWGLGVLLGTALALVASFVLARTSP